MMVSIYTVSNDESVVTIRANSQPNGDLGLSLTGAGITAGVWEVEIRIKNWGSKIIFGDGAFSAHSTM
jgi:hypothetical protein